MKMIVKEHPYVNDKKNRMVLHVEDQDKKVEHLIFWQKMVQDYEGVFSKGDNIEITGNIDGPKFEATHPCDGMAYTIRSDTKIEVIDSGVEEDNYNLQQEIDNAPRVNQDLIDGPDNVIEKKIKMGQGPRLVEMEVLKKEDGAFIMNAPIKGHDHEHGKPIREKEGDNENTTEDYIDVIDKVNAQSVAQEKKRVYPPGFGKGSARLANYQKEQNTKLTEETIKKYVSLSCPTADDKDIEFFIAFCLNQNLNPFIKDCYLVKYGKNPATIITAKDAFLKRADEQDDFRGFLAGIIVQKKVKINITTTLGQHGPDEFEDVIEERSGSFYLPEETLVGGWAKIFRKDKEPFYDSVRRDEYEQKKADGTLNKFWKEKPATMIRKVALVHALREAYPKAFQGMYDKSEMIL